MNLLWPRFAKFGSWKQGSICVQPGDRCMFFSWNLLQMGRHGKHAPVQTRLHSEIAQSFANHRHLIGGVHKHVNSWGQALIDCLSTSRRIFWVAETEIIFLVAFNRKLGHHYFWTNCNDVIPHHRNYNVAYIGNLPDLGMFSLLWFGQITCSCSNTSWVSLL